MKKGSIAIAVQWLLLVCLVVSTIAKTGSGTAATGNRDFPADTKLDKWDGSAGQTYLQQLIIQSGGLGIGLGFLFSIFMFFHLMCWGMCSPCCRCCCFRYKKVKLQSCWDNQDNYKWFLLASLLIFLISIAGVGIIFGNQSHLYEDIGQTFDHAKEFIGDWADFQCAGLIVDDFRSGKSLSDVQDQYGGTAGAIAKCSVTSVGGFLHGANTQVNTTFQTIINLIDGMQNIINSLNNTIDKVENTTSIATAINATVYLMKNQSELINSTLVDTLATSSNFSAYLPRPADIPKVESQDTYIPGQAVNSLAEAKNELVNARQGISPTIVDDLLLKTKPEIQSQWGYAAAGAAAAFDILCYLFSFSFFFFFFYYYYCYYYYCIGSIYRSLLDIESQMLKHVNQALSKEDNIDSTKSSTTSSETYGELAMALLYSLSCVFLLTMIIGYLCKKRWPICLGGYLIFFTFLWLAFILGIFLVLSMISYDICGCEGTYSVESCQTLITMLRTNLGSTEVKVRDDKVLVADIVQQILECPNRVNDQGIYDYSPDSNFIDIMQVLGAFNFSKEVQKPIIQLNNATSSLYVSRYVDQVLNQTGNARNAMALVAVATAYNFSSDYNQYNDLLTGLRGLNPAQYYSGVYNPVTNQQNIDRLSGILKPSNEEMEANRDSLNEHKRNYNISIDQINVAANAINAAVENSRRDIGNSVNEIYNMVNYILTVNRYTPCAIIGKAYKNIWITDFCDNVYETLDGVVPGAILCLAAMLTGFFLLIMMRDCVRIIQEDWREDQNDIRMGIVSADGKKQNFVSSNNINGLVKCFFLAA